MIRGFILSLISVPVNAGKEAKIALAQVGYYPSSTKVAGIYNLGATDSFEVCEKGSNTVVFSGDLQKKGVVYLADFSDLSTEGTFKSADP